MSSPESINDSPEQPADPIFTLQPALIQLWVTLSGGRETIDWAKKQDDQPSMAERFRAYAEANPDLKFDIEDQASLVSLLEEVERQVVPGNSVD